MKRKRRTTTAAEAVKIFSKAEKDYEYNNDVFSEDEDRVAALKRIIARLPRVDRTIMVLYFELQSTRELAKVLHVGTTTARNEVNRIRRHILEEYSKTIIS